MTASAGIVWLDIEAAKTNFTPVSTARFHFLDGFDASNVATDHNSSKVAEPVGPESLDRKWVDHWVSIPILNLFVQRLTQIGQ